MRIVTALLLSSLWISIGNVSIATAQHSSARRLEAPEVVSLETSGQSDESDNSSLYEIDVDSLNMDEAVSYLHQLVSANTDRREISTTWTGLLKPPYSGVYQFSTTPINVNQLGRQPVRHRIVVTLGGKVVLDTESEEDGQDESSNTRRKTSASQWNWEGKPIELVGGTPIPVKVEMTYSNKAANKFASPSALLFWEGPTLEQQIIAPVFFAGQGDNKKLRAEYCWPSKDSERVVVQPSDNVEFAWSSAKSVASPRPDLVQELSDRVHQLAMSSTYVDQCITGNRRHAYFYEDLTTDYLSLSNKNQFLDLLLSHTDLLQEISESEIRSVYQRFRFGAEEKALAMLGRWFSLNEDVVPKFTNHFFRDNRQVYWELGSLLSNQLPVHIEKLQKDYLEANNGRCVLPVAYLLSYAHATNALTQSRPSRGRLHRQNPFEEWVEFLDDKLNDRSISGDSRINWLLARAHAAEMIRQPALYNARGKERLWEGREWIDEGMLTVDSEQIRLRLVQEQIARLVAYRMWDEAATLFEKNHSPEEATKWQRALADLKREADSILAAEKHRQEARKINEFKRRQMLAEARGDDTTAKRYEVKIDQLEETLKLKD